MKSAYTRPRLVVYGKLEEITRGNHDGQYTDQSFPANTKRSDLTFSG